MIKKLTSKTRSALLSGTVVVTTGVLISAVFGYLLQLFLGRMLSVADYGTFNALLSLMYLVGVPAGVLGTTIIKVSSELSAKEQFSKLTALFWRLVLAFSALGIGFFLLLSFSRNFLATQLNIEDPSLFIPFGIMLAVSYLVVTPNSYLQGLLRFKAYAFHLVLASVLRFVFPIALIFYGYKVGGVFIGISLSVLTSFLVALILLKKNFRKLEAFNLRKNFEKIVSFSLPVLFITSGLMFLNNMDMILVKKYFDPTLAGYYAGTVTLGKILLFGAGTVATVMFPQISALYTRKEPYLEKFKQLFSLQLLIVSGGVLVFTFCPRLLTLTFFGERFYNSIDFLPRFALFIGLYVLVNFMVMFFLAIEKTRVFLFLLPVVVIQYILITFNHSTLMEVININVIVTLVLLISLFVYFFFARKKKLL
jgi:O-antigen/teichoic acid export membrane protein